MSLPTLIVKAAFGSNPMSTPSWTAISAYVREVQIRRGRRSEMDRVDTGTATIILSNADRRFDPTYTLGPYSGQIWPMVKITVQATWAGTTYDLFTGFAESWRPEWPQKKEGIVTLECADGLKVIGLYDINNAYGEESSDVRVNNVLDDVGWTAGNNGILDDAINGLLNTTMILAPNGDREIHGGHIDCQAVSLVDTSALQHIDAIREIENGNYYVDKSGVFVFHNAHTSNYNPYDTSQATFGDGGGSELPYYDLAMSFDDAVIYNSMRCTRTGGTEQTASDAASITKYVTRTLRKNGLLNTSDIEMKHLAEWLLAHYKDLTLYGTTARMRLDSMVLRGQADDNLWPQILGRELDDRITVKRRPNANETITTICTIAGMGLRIGRDKLWEAAWQLVPADIGIYLQLNHVTYGVLNTARLSY